MRTLKIIGIVIAILFLTGWLIQGIQYVTKTGEYSKNQIKGYSMTKEAFNSGCVPEAIKSSGQTEQIATTYCSCVFDKGVEYYGGTEQWTTEMNKMTEETITPQMSDFINQCVVYTNGLN